jgi:hypothetical protein
MAKHCFSGVPSFFLIGFSSSSLPSFLVKRGGYSIHVDRKESGHGKITRSDEEGFGVKEF